MIIICYQIKDFETYTRTQSPRSVGAIAINVQQISTITPMELWVDGKEKEIYEVEVGANGELTSKVKKLYQPRPSQAMVLVNNRVNNNANKKIVASRWWIK